MASKTEQSKAMKIDLQRKNVCKIMGRFWSLLCLALTGSNVWAQQGNINTSIFRESAMRGRVEICWQVAPTALHYQRVSETDSTIAANYETELRIYKDTTLVKTDRWMTRTPAVLPRQAALLNLLDGYSQAVPSGKYRVEIHCKEPLSPQTAFVLKRDFEVDLKGLQTLAAPKLLDTFYQSPQPEGVFVRDGLLSLPLAANFLGDEKRDLHFYTEAYESGEAQKAKKPLRFESKILKGDAPFGRFSRTDTCNFRNGVATLYATLPVTKLPSGNFVLQLSLLDAQGKVLETRTRSFQRSNASPETDTLVGAAVDSVLQAQKPDSFVDANKTFVQAYKPAQLRAILRMIQPLATPEEGLSIKVLSQKGTDLTYVRTFIYSFFAFRNPRDPEGEWNAYAEKVRTVNRLFNIGSRAGYETDRGRVYLQYGPPDERITVPQESGSRPYEVWRYETTPKDGKGGKFLFFQPGGPLEDYLLLHSTVAGEMRNRSWRAGLYSEGVNERSRAEILFPER